MNNTLIKRLGWKIHPFDIVLACVIVFGILGFFLFFYRKGEYVNIRLKVTDQDVLYAITQPQNWYADRFVVGDMERDSLGKKWAEITGVETYSVTDTKKAVYLDMNIRAAYDTRTGMYYAKGRPLVFGAPLRFDFGTVTFDGIVTEFPGHTAGIGYHEGTTRVTTLLRAAEPTLAQSFHEGDTIVNSRGNQLARIVNVTVTNAQRVTQTAQGALLLQEDPLYKDVTFSLDIRTHTLHGETYAFDNIPLKVGGPLPLNFTYSSILPIITGITDSK